MAFRRFEDLRVFKWAELLADEIWDTVITWKYFERNTVGQQWVDEADSIGANIAEGAGRGTPNDNRRFIRIS
jgi:four helix bundle protein